MTDPLKPLLAGLDGTLEALARKASAASALTAQVRESLPPTLGAHVVGAARRGDDLVVIVDSAAWSARVRYAGDELRAQLLARGEAVTGRIRVRVGRKKVDRG